jgi:acetylornithine deacetylase/succinyl-diaminopimelate desuccinylase-like protein
MNDAGDLASLSVVGFGIPGVDAVNLGPGDPRYAHADEERIDNDALVRCRDVLATFFAGPTTS